ncbi:YjbE family putative metal transport protein [Heliobacterium gestii]|uniref:YjbE family putative metal transport protein n=1 Tax=Heliomicrobium gestii TaxID=2699 RepID=A0A845L6F5_HELGE|nr:TerC family protein [Heliomicrobium gestii]MBM7866818.1 YjbE family integral membrane protein [Heliomicrobium gestii]MZP42247.1 YjbE family putative metal transport protein [Heliomicrobium gestii]
MDWGMIAGILNIIVINLVLSGDNAVVIAMASKGLPEEYRKKAIFWGAALAVVLRILLTFLVALLLRVPLIQLVGGLLLAWIALKLLYPEKETKNMEEATDDFKKVLFTILGADLLMSLDNVLAVAGASQGNFYLLVFGLLLSIPIVLVGSTFLSNLLSRYAWLVYVGSGILAWTAGKMIVEDKSVGPFLEHLPISEYLVPLAITAIVILVGKWIRDRALAAEGS